MKQILLFGAGKSSTAAIDYFLEGAAAHKWGFTVVDASVTSLQERLGGRANASAVAIDVRDGAQREDLIEKADVVLSLMPPALHILIAKDCLRLKKNLITASYTDEAIQSMATEIEAAGLLFLYEMGLDPGIDHMSAKKLIDEIQAAGGCITSFHSHCGGLVAPESDDNPWHYKISWNPRNVVMAGKAGAVYRQGDNTIQLGYEELFAESRFVDVPGEEALCWYPNRDSLAYIPVYGLEGSATFIRTTLRHSDFMYGWKNLIDLRLTDETLLYDTDRLSLMDFFKLHMERAGFGEWLQQRLSEQFDSTKTLLTELMNLMELEQQAEEKGVEPVEDFMMVDDQGGLQRIDIDDLKTTAAATVAERMHTANLTLKQLFFLGMDDKETIIDKGRCSAADVLQLALEKKLPLLPADKDRVVMQHEIGYTLGENSHTIKSTLLLDGDDGTHTAMAKTVGLPMAIAAEMMLNGQLQLKGLQIPTSKAIYEPVLEALAKHGIVFSDQTTAL